MLSFVWLLMRKLLCAFVSYMVMLYVKHISNAFGVKNTLETISPRTSNSTIRVMVRARIIISMCRTTGINIISSITSTWTRTSSSMDSSMDNRDRGMVGLGSKAVCTMVLRVVLHLEVLHLVVHPKVVPLKVAPHKAAHPKVALLGALLITHSITRKLSNTAATINLISQIPITQTRTKTMVDLIKDIIITITEGLDTLTGSFRGVSVICRRTII
jgi:hypothetical protein